MTKYATVPILFSRQRLRRMVLSALVGCLPLSALADDPVNGATLYNANCAGCHGATPQTVDSIRIGNGRNARAVLDASLNLGPMTGLRSTFPSGGGNLADVAAYLGSLPGTLNFTSTAVGSTSATQSVTIYPSLKAGSDLSGITVSTTGDFARNGGTCSTTLAAGGSSCTVLVQFTPSAAGTRTGELSLQHNRTLTPIKIALSGTATSTGVAGPGSLDASFNSVGMSIIGTAGASQTPLNRAVALQSDGKILVAGSTSSNFTVRRLLANGTRDSAFGFFGESFPPSFSGSNPVATSIAVQADGKIVVAGSVTGLNSASDFAVARFTAAGAVDTSFNGVGFVITPISTVTNNGTPEDEAWGVAIQADQKIVVVGTTTTKDGSGNAYRELAVVRYNTNGTADTSFGPSGIRTGFTSSSSPGFAVRGHAVAIQADGKIVVGGEGGVGFAAVRIHGLATTGTPGTLDTSFNGTGVFYVSASVGCSKCRTDNGARSVAIHSDGKIVLAGYSDNSLNNGDAPNDNTKDMNFAVLRLNTSGAADSSFGTNGKGFVITRATSSLPSSSDRRLPYDQAYGVAIQTDGKVVVAGDSVGTSGYTDFALVRYNADGSLDTGFGPGGTGKVITPVLVPSGSTNTSDGGRAVVIQTDGKIVVAGYSTNATTNGPDFAMVRYLGTTPTVAAGNPRDFNGDGKSDIVWLNTAKGDVAIWLMNGTTLVSGVGVETVPLDWQIVGTGDFNGDGKPDIVWQNPTHGARVIWYMDGTKLVGGESFAQVPVEWQIRGVGDFNGDGKPDLVWQNTITGDRVIWLMNGKTLISGSSFGVVPPDWNIVGVADFNGDNKPDILFQRNNGDLAVWLMDGNKFASGVGVGGVNTEWLVTGAGDYNGDGKPDIMFQNRTYGTQVIWIMNGTTYVSGAAFAFVPLEWRMTR